MAKPERRRRKKTKFVRVTLLLNQMMHLALLRKAERDGQSMGAVVKSILAIALRDQVERIERESASAVAQVGD